MQPTCTLFRAVSSVALCAAVLLPLTAAADAGRVVAVGDVHGAYDELVAILERAELIDGQGRWIGGSTTFVQTGDLFDRGLEVFDVMDLLMRLQEEAAAAGGQVIVLLGNHEGMNLIGFFRDVNPQIYARLADEDSEKRRKQGFKGFKKYLQKRNAAAGLGPPLITDELEDRWMGLYPPGRIEYEEAIGPEARYGRWLRTLPAAVLIDGTLFIHAGLGPTMAGMSIAEINAEVAAELAAYDATRAFMLEEYLIPPHVGFPDMMAVYGELAEPLPELAPLAEADDWLLHSSEGPLWYRGAARMGEAPDSDQGAQAESGDDPDEYPVEDAAEAAAEANAGGEAEALVARLEAVGAERMVGGHTPQKPRRIQTRLDGRVILIDTGMLSSVYTGGRPSALVIEDGTFEALYLDGSEPLEAATALPDAA